MKLTFYSIPFIGVLFLCRELRSVDTAVGATRLTDVAATGEALARGCWCFSNLQPWVRRAGALASKC